MSEFEWNEVLMLIVVISVNLAKEHSLWRDLYHLRRVVVILMGTSCLTVRSCPLSSVENMFTLEQDTSLQTCASYFATSTDNMETHSKNSSYWSCCPETGKEKYSFCLFGNSVRSSSRCQYYIEKWKYNSLWQWIKTSLHYLTGKTYVIYNWQRKKPASSGSWFLICLGIDSFSCWSTPTALPKEC